MTTMTTPTDTPRTDAAKVTYARWRLRYHGAEMRGSHLDSNDPRPPDGWETAEALERECAELRKALKGLARAKIITGMSAAIRDWAEEKGIKDPLEAARRALTPQPQPEKI